MKKLLIIFSVLAMATAVGPAAAGAVTLEAGGEALEAGAPIVAVSTNTVFVGPASTFECEEVELVGEVSENPGNPAIAVISEGRAEGGGAVPSDCDSSNPTVSGITITVGPVGPVEVGNGTVSTAVELGAIFHIEGPDPVCSFSGVLAGTFALNAPLGLEIGPSTLAASGTTCAVADRSLDGDFEVTSGGAPVEVS